MASIPRRLLSALYCQAWAGRVRWVSRARLAILAPLRFAWGIAPALNRSLLSAATLHRRTSDHRCAAPDQCAFLCGSVRSAHVRNAPLNARFRTVAAEGKNVSARGKTPSFRGAPKARRINNGFARLRV